MFPFKVTTGKQLHPNDYHERLNFCEEVLLHDHEFINNILWSDEANFLLDGRVNRQNVRFWGTEKPTAIEEHATFSQSIT
jgi:hypothetical protein